MLTDPRYMKVNASPTAAQVLKIIAAEQHKFVYEVVDEILKENFPSYF
jgi:hypothetical protein